MRHTLPILAVLTGLLAAPVAVQARNKIDCELRYSLTGWSVFYKTASGSGTITCDNGQSMKVKIRAKGGGLTFGKQTITDGRGRFTEAHNITELLGTYAQGGAHAGVVKSAGAQVVTKGEISLALAGKGEGVDLGIDFGKFVISR
ncbi:MAG: hypothetical protein U1F22_09005 [Lysobacterales bacterium]